MSDGAILSADGPGELGEDKRANNANIGAPKQHTIKEINIRGERDGLTRLIGLATVIAALLTGAASFMILSGLTPIAPTPHVTLTVVLVNGALISVLVFLIGREVYRLIQSRRRGRAAARLHIRIIGLFSLVAAVPAILVAILAGITLDVGLDRWFEIRTKRIVESSTDVARAYMNESFRGLQGTTVSMARDLDKSAQLYTLDQTGFRQLLTLQTRGRGVLGAFLLREDGTIVMESDIKQEPALPPPPQGVMKTAADGEPVLIPPGGSKNLVGAVFKLREIPGTYLYTLRSMNPKVIAALRLMEANTAEYRGLEANRLTNQIAFAILYIGVCLIVLLSAMWMGISVADRFVAPIRRLINAADEVRNGNLDVVVSTHHAEGDLRNLSSTFNGMVGNLKSQRDELVDANNDIDQRARFTEAVLSGVSSAVIGVTDGGQITIANPLAIDIFGDGISSTGNKGTLEDTFPELNSVLQNARHSKKPEYGEQITMMNSGRERTYNIQVTSETDTVDNHSWVITIDDITDLVSAQRNNAWADVAQRIAHEIKNPLTPIQLSAERIRRRFGKQIEADKEVFDQCTDTIVRQVSDIGRMVDEFSSFARMPKPEMKKQDVRDSVKEAVFLQKVANPDIQYSINLGEQPVLSLVDNRLLSQALTNVIKNAGEAIEAIEEKDHKGQITINLHHNNDQLSIDVIDNGKGLPQQDRQKLLEPYMTTREKGTGLGLAIVRKVMEDHSGNIELMDAPNLKNGETGALMRLNLPLAKAE